MKKTKNRKPTWLLTVAAAYAVLPGCGDDDPSDADKRDTGAQNVTDAGSVVRPPDAGSNVADAGILVSLVDAGIVASPPDAGNDASASSVAPSDASIDAAVSAADASADAQYEWVGLLSRSPARTP